MIIFNNQQISPSLFNMRIVKIMIGDKKIWEKKQEENDKV